MARLLSDIREIADGDHEALKLRVGFSRSLDQGKYITIDHVRLSIVMASCAWCEDYLTMTIYLGNQSSPTRSGSFQANFA